MTFKEAYEANKTKSVRRKGEPSYNVNSLEKFTAMPVESAIADDWEVVQEPEVVEFEWNCLCGIPQMPYSLLFGKRWKVVCTEVVE